MNEEHKDIFGCDIGNGYGYISLLIDQAKDPVAMFPTNQDHLDKMGMRSSAYIVPPDGKNIEVYDGRTAYKKHIREPEKFIHAVKTRLKEGKIPVPGISNPVSPTDVYGAIVRDLVILGNQERKNRGEKPIYDLVFTFPAAFTEDISLLNKMQSSIENIEIDEKKLKVRGRLPEPAAVAIDYLYYNEKILLKNITAGIKTKDSHTVLVYDLGHGTFDVAVVTANKNGDPYKLHINAGLPDVGGKDFDDIIYNEICKKLKMDYGYTPTNENERENIREEANSMKHDLSDYEEADTNIFLKNGESAEIQITRSVFEAKSRGVINRTFELVEQVLTQAKEQNIQIDGVFLSGGASQMPMIKQGLEQMLDGENIPVNLYRPSNAVSYGAARYAYGILDNQKQESVSTGKNKINPVLRKYTEYSYGFWMPSEAELEGKIQLVVNSKQQLPVTSEKVKLFAPSSRLVIKVNRTKTKFYKKNDAAVEACESIMQFPFDVPKNSECEVSITVLEDYNVKVTCTPNGAAPIEKSTKDDLKKLL